MIFTLHTEAMDDHLNAHSAGEGFKRAWPPLIKMDEAVRKKIDQLFK